MPTAASGPASVRRHGLSEREFDALAAGGGDQRVVAHLRSAERSRRLLLLRAVLDDTSVASDRASAEVIESAWQVLTRIERHFPGAVEEALLHPHLGAWAGSVLRRLNGVSTSPVPLWAECGYLSLLAAATAIKAGVDVTLSVPVHRGALVLPTLGVAAVGAKDEWTRAELRRESGRTRVVAPGSIVVLPDDLRHDTREWYAQRELEATADGLRVRLALDDLDPYREFGRVSRPQRVTSQDLRRWQQLFDQAWSLLAARHRESAAALAVGLTTLVPRPAVHRFRTFSGTADDSFGTMAMSLPPDAATLAVTLLHEFQHTKLGALLHLASMYDGDTRERAYAPWRPDPRPAASLIQGVYAFMAVSDFWRIERTTATGVDARFAQVEFAHWRDQTWHAWRALRAERGLTELGRRFVAGMGRRMEAWQEESVPPRYQAIADAIAADHRATWRLRHVRPAAAQVEMLVEAWSNGCEPSVSDRAGSIVPGAVGSARENRGTLMRLRLVDPAAFRQLVSDRPADVDMAAGDASYLVGDHERAVREYSDQLVSQPGRIEAWAGLGLALKAAGRRRAASALLEFPELAHAVHEELSRRGTHAPTPEALAEWLGRG